MLSNNSEGYPLIHIDCDGNVLCGDCAQEDLNEIEGQVNWEGPTIQCSCCDCDLESAYGDPDEDD